MIAGDSAKKSEHRAQLWQGLNSRFGPGQSLTGVSCRPRCISVTVVGTKGCLARHESVFPPDPGTSVVNASFTRSWGRQRWFPTPELGKLSSSSSAPLTSSPSVGLITPCLFTGKGQAAPPTSMGPALWLSSPGMLRSLSSRNQTLRCSPAPASSLCKDVWSWLFSLPCPQGLWSHWALQGSAPWLLMCERVGAGVLSRRAKQRVRTEQREVFPKDVQTWDYDPAFPLMEELASESEKKVPEQAMRSGRKLTCQGNTEWRQAGALPSALRWVRQATRARDRSNPWPGCCPTGIFSETSGRLLQTHTHLKSPLFYHLLSLQAPFTHLHILRGQVLKENSCFLSFNIHRMFGPKRERERGRDRAREEKYPYWV